MRLDELKKGFWGYRKESVYRYIAALEEETSKKLEEKDAQLKKVEGEIRQRLSELENALKEAQKENEAMRENQMVISATLLEAQRFAELLKEDSFRREREAQAELDTAMEQKMRELNVYSTRIRQLRETFQNMLKELDDKTEALEQEMEILQTQAPVTNLSLFQRKSETGYPEKESQEKEPWKKSSSM